MEPNTWQELSSLINDLWMRLQLVRDRNAPLFAFAVVALVLFEGLMLGALLDLLLPRRHATQKTRAKRRRRK